VPEGFRLLLSDDRFPVQAYFNIWPDADFLPMLSKMSRGVESTYNEVGWSWSGGESDPHLPSDSVLFFCGEEEVVIATGEALTHLKSAVEIYVSRNPKDATEARQLVEAVRAKLHTVG
jgi:hypothetical protein